MSWRTSGAVPLLRNLGRSIGLNRLLASFLGAGYEDRFHLAMLGAIRQGDVVWDVGANVGLYAQKFSDIVGPTGRVIAYEPSPANLQRLNEAVGSRVNITVVPMALGQSEDVVLIEQGNDTLGATSRIVGKAVCGSGRQVEVQMSSGDYLVSSCAVAMPNVIKIDTEGFELDVLLGLKRTLMQKSLRMVCIEVHFGLLKEQGFPRAPSDIEKLLVSAGFSLAWPDVSHLVATRAD